MPTATVNGKAIRPPYPNREVNEARSRTEPPILLSHRFHSIESPVPPGKAYYLYSDRMEPGPRSESHRDGGSGGDSPRGPHAKSAQGGAFGRPDEVLAEIREELGPEETEAARRSSELARHPRPLTNDESAELRATLAAVLADLRATGAILPDIREEAHEDSDPGVVSAWIQSPLGMGGMGIRVLVSEPPAERLAGSGRPNPGVGGRGAQCRRTPGDLAQCPRHPGTHPLSARSHQGQAAWCCPKSMQVISPVGALAAPDSVTTQVTRPALTTSMHSGEARAGRLSRLA